MSRLYLQKVLFFFPSTLLFSMSTLFFRLSFHMVTKMTTSILRVYNPEKRIISPLLFHPYNSKKRKEEIELFLNKSEPKRMGMLIGQTVRGSPLSGAAGKEDSP